MINAPVLHVNGDYPEGQPFCAAPSRQILIHSLDVARAVETTFKYRDYFRKVRHCGLMSPRVSSTTSL
jgi:probable 2-oxoglutarate dehydrogenase E1 component DHKTD1